MEPFKNILIPIGLSPLSEPILAVGKKIAAYSGAKIHVQNVIDATGIYSVSHIYDVGQLREQLIQNARSDLYMLVEKAGMKDLGCEVSVSVGVPFMEIIYRAVEIASDLVIMGSKQELGVFRRFLLGNTAYKIVRRVPCSMLSIKVKSDAEIPEDIPFNKVLVALDFSPHSIKALEYAIYLKSIFNFDIHVFNVESPLAEKSQAPVSLEDKIARYLDEGGRKAITSLTAEANQRPAEAILRKAKELDVDLIAIGSHSEKRILKNIFLGQIAYDVVRKAECSVLAVKQPIMDDSVTKDDSSI